MSVVFWTASARTLTWLHRWSTQTGGCTRPQHHFLLTCPPNLSHRSLRLTQLISILFQMLLSRPLFSGNPQLQQQIRKQIPRFLQQVSSLPSLLNTSMLWLHRNIGAKCIHHLHDNHSFVQHTTFFSSGHWIQVIHYKLHTVSTQIPVCTVSGEYLHS